VVGQDRHVAQRAQREIGRALEDEADRPLGHELDRVHVVELGAEDRRLGALVLALAQQRLQRRLHVQDAERVVVVPADTAAHLQRDAHAVVGDVPALGEQRTIRAPEQSMSV